MSYIPFHLRGSRDQDPRLFVYYLSCATSRQGKRSGTDMVTDMRCWSEALAQCTRGWELSTQWVHPTDPFVDHCLHLLSAQSTGENPIRGASRLKTLKTPMRGSLNPQCRSDEARASSAPPPRRCDMFIGRWRIVACMSRLKVDLPLLDLT